MEPFVIVALAGVGLLVIGLVVSGAARRAIARRRPPPPTRQEKAAAVIKSVIDAGTKAWELAPVVRDSMQSIVAWTDANRGLLRSNLAADGTVTLFFSDIEDSTAANARLGDEGWMDVLRHHTALVQQLVKAHKGNVVKSQGDGFMVAFKDPVAAVRCAMALQDGLDERAGSAEPLRVRIGVHTGEAISEGKDFLGANVAFAARVAQSAGGGEILVSQAVHDRVADADGIELRPARVVELKGLPGTHQLFEVGVHQ